MKENRLIIVGRSQIGQRLIKHLSKDYDITCIESDISLIEEGEKDTTEGVKYFHGDATSRLTLEKANIENSPAIIITITNEEVVLEIARVIQTYFSVSRVISVSITEEVSSVLEGMNVEVENIFKSAAGSLRNRIEKNVRTAHGIGISQNEIIEVELHPNSRFSNKVLGNIAPINWNIGIIYRDGNIIVPRSDTELKPRDRIVILGDPEVLKTVSEIITFDFVQFPLQYGSSIVAYISGQENDSYFEEIFYLYTIFKLKDIILLLSKRAVDEEQTIRDRADRIFTAAPYRLVTDVSDIMETIEKTVNELYGKCGMIVFEKEVFMKLSGGFFSLFTHQNLLGSIMTVARCPVLLSSNSFPYDTTAVPIIRGSDITHTLEASMEISLTLDNELTAVMVKPSEYIATDEEMEDFKEAKKVISDTSMVYKKKIAILTGKGNPIKEMSTHLTDFNLVVFEWVQGSGQGLISSVFNPDVGVHLIRRLDKSTMLIPSIEESL